NLAPRRPDESLSVPCRTSPKGRFDLLPTARAHRRASRKEVSAHGARLPLSRRGEAAKFFQRPQAFSARATNQPSRIAMKPVILPKSSFDQVVAQAEREFPFECCGFIIGDGTVEDVRPITNIQNAMHDQDPIAFARDARTAFLMDPREHLAVMNEI